MPGNFGNATLDLLWILEDHDSLGGDWLRHILWLLSLEVFLEEIDLIVLLDAAGGSLNQVLGGTNEVEVWLLEKLSHVLVDFVWLMGVVIFRPTSNHVVTSLVVSGNALCVNLYKERSYIFAMITSGMEAGKYTPKLCKLISNWKFCNLRDAQRTEGCCRERPCLGF